MRKYLHLSLADKATVIGIVFILVAFLIFVLYPLIYVIIDPYDPNQLNASDSLWFQWLQLDGYRKILSDSAIGRGFLMSLFYSSAFTIVTVSVSLTLLFRYQEWILSVVSWYPHCCWLPCFQWRTDTHIYSGAGTEYAWYRMGLDPSKCCQCLEYHSCKDVLSSAASIAKRVGGIGWS